MFKILLVMVVMLLVLSCEDKKEAVAITPSTVSDDSQVVDETIDLSKEKKPCEDSKKFDEEKVFKLQGADEGCKAE